MAVLMTVVVTTDAVVPVPVEDVRVWVYTAEDVYVTDGNTDSSGEIGFMLDGAVDPGTEYLIRLRKDGYSFPLGPTQKAYVIEPEVPETPNIFDVAIHLATLPESADPDMCLLSGYLVDASLRPVAATKVKFLPRKGFPDEMHVQGMYYPSDPSVIRDRIIVRETVATTNSLGYLSIPLPRDSWFDVYIQGAEDPRFILSAIYIPDQASFRFEDVMFPYARTVGYSDESVSLAVGETVAVDLEVFLSNTQQITESEDLVALLEFTPEDTDIITSVIDSEGKLSLSGLAVGSTTVSVARVSGSAAPRRPSLADLIAPTLTVQVS